MSEKRNEEQKISFKDTLNLPHTDFPIRSNPSVDDAALIERWEREDLALVSTQAHKGAEQFVLHDGPPYANGHIHIGHAYNKILKDIIGKSKRMQGKHAPITPGWDCHGLPIELKVSLESPGLSNIELKKKCREYAQGWINIQKEEFKKLGVLMDWKHPYLTMSPGYEASIIESFGTFVDQGYIERKNKTVPWCASCKTVLASAEIEYQDRKDPSIYVLFPLCGEAKRALFDAEFASNDISLVIWTTTPWTLPLNRAVMIKPSANYDLLDLGNGRYAIVGSDCSSALCASLGIEKNVVKTMHAQEFIRSRIQVNHPFIEHMHVPLIPSDTVSTTDGTAFVHCAPGCGPEDYEVGVKHGLEIFSPVSVDGKYTKGILPEALLDMSVADGQIWVIKQLAANGRLLYKTSIKHSYPHCWRCHQGLIFRATKQWFCDLSKHDLKHKTLRAIDGIVTYPEKSANRLKATVDGRLEWCLSRQRIWGVPIPSLLCTSCDYTYTNKTLIDRVAEKVAHEGIEYWDTISVETLLDNKTMPCPSCNAYAWVKEQDILDVWFDSGVSHAAVLKKQNQFPADIYLEGKDQHRGWFQSSLLTSLVIEGKSPMRELITHGFTVDQQGRKMSKSIGNVVSPDQIIKELGTDGLRLWVSSIDYADDAVISPILLANVKEVLRKIRNTCRFLLSNLYDYNHGTDAVSHDALLELDRYALWALAKHNERWVDLYNEYNFTALFHQLADYCATDLSSFYLDIIKDRLYVEDPSGRVRRSAQTVCWYTLDALTKIMAPILSFNAELISDHYQKDKKSSIHLQQFADLHAHESLVRDSASYVKQWDVLKEIRAAVLKAIELLRAEGIIKHSLEAHVQLYVDTNASWYQEYKQLLSAVKASQQLITDFLEEFFIVSQVTLLFDKASVEEAELKGLYVKVQPADGVKCPRCWHWSVSRDVDGLCDRCMGLVRK